jgi:hypothetical protein
MHFQFTFEYFINLNLIVFSILLVFNLANNLDEDDTLKKIEELKKETKESSKNKSRVVTFFIITTFKRYKS